MTLPSRPLPSPPRQPIQAVDILRESAWDCASLVPLYSLRNRNLMMSSEPTFPSKSVSRQNVVRVMTLAAALVVICGCTPATSDSPVGKSEQPPERDRETWEVLRIGEARVGYSRTTICTERCRGAQVLRIEGTSRMKFNRAGEQVELGVDFGSRQTPGGRLIDFRTLISQGPAAIQDTRARVVGDKLQIETTTQGKAVAASVPWAADFGGPLASQLGLLEKPMEPGERRTVHEIVPAANVVGTTEMVAHDYEPVNLPGRSPSPGRLLRIDVSTSFPDGGRQRSTIWTDRTGDVLRSREEAMNLESVRATKEEALAELKRAEFDLMLGLSVEVDRPLDHPHDTKRVRYRLHLDGTDPAQVFLSGPSQEVRSIDPHTAEVTVYAVRPGETPKSPNPKIPKSLNPEKPTAADLASNSLIQSDNPQIVAAARKVAADPANAKDPWQLAVALERYVHQRITSADYSQAFDTAAEVMETGQGDCTEHAVLLAALARACGVPARVAIGLVYTEQTGRPAFAYHMWNELYVGGRWIPMDATLGRGGIGAAHLKLAASDLEGASAFSSFLPVAQVAGRLRIEIKEVQ